MAVGGSSFQCLLLTSWGNQGSWTGGRSACNLGELPCHCCLWPSPVCYCHSKKSPAGLGHEWLWTFPCPEKARNSSDHGQIPTSSAQRQTLGNSCWTGGWGWEEKGCAAEHWMVGGGDESCGKEYYLLLGQRRPWQLVSAREQGQVCCNHPCCIGNISPTPLFNLLEPPILTIDIELLQFLPLPPSKGMAQWRALLYSTPWQVSSAVVVRSRKLAQDLIPLIYDSNEF